MFKTTKLIFNPNFNMSSMFSMCKTQIIVIDDNIMTNHSQYSLPTKLYLGNIKLINLLLAQALVGFFIWKSSFKINSFT